jgi:hypothetical protein
MTSYTDPAKRLCRCASNVAEPRTIALDGIFREHGKLFLAVAGKMIHARPRDIGTCERFLRRAQQEFSFPVTHACLQLPTHVQRQVGWVAAVRDAYRRGVRTGTAA